MLPFEMESELFIQLIRWKGLPGFLYQNGKKGKRARKRRDRERLCKRQTVAAERHSVGNKTGS